MVMMVNILIATRLIILQNDVANATEMRTDVSSNSL